MLIIDGRIAAVGGPDLKPPPGVDVIDATGRWVLPGLVDAHTHLGAREEGEGWAGHDTNELTGPIQAHVRVLDAINPADEGFRDAIARRRADRGRSPPAPATRSAGRRWRSTAGAGPSTTWCSAPPPG